MINKFYQPIIKTFGYNHFRKYHNSHYSPLYRAYSEAHRSYHNQDHIRNVALEAGFREGAAWWANKPKSDNVKKLVLAAYYHDLYPNVRKSAKNARRKVRELGFSEEYSNFVFNAIRATRLHTTTDPLIQKLINADLHILTTYHQHLYIRYMLSVRLEYPNLTDLEYSKQRRKTLCHYREIIKFDEDENDIRGEYIRADKNLVFEQNILYQFECLSNNQSWYLQPRSLIAVLSDLNNLVGTEYYNIIKLK